MFGSLSSPKLFLYFFSSSLHSLGIIETLLTFISKCSRTKPTCINAFINLAFQISVSIHIHLYIRNQIKFPMDCICMFCIQELHDFVTIFLKIFCKRTTISPPLSIILALVKMHLGIFSYNKPYTISSKTKPKKKNQQQTKQQPRKKAPHPLRKFWIRHWYKIWPD